MSFAAAHSRIQLVFAAMLTACAASSSPRALASPVTVDPAPIIYPAPSLLAPSDPSPRPDDAPSATTLLLASLRADPATARPEIVTALRTVLSDGPTLPETDRARLTPTLLELLATAAPGARGDDLRVPAIGALAAIRSLDAAPQIAAILVQPLSASLTTATARAAADALGEIRDPATVDALIVAMLADVAAAEVPPSCLRALARIGARHAVPALLAALDGREPGIARALATAGVTTGSAALPDGYVQSTLANALAGFASETAIEPLLALLADRARPADVRTAAADALARTAVAVPAEHPRIVAAIVQVLEEPISRDDRPWLAPPMASALARTGAPAAIPPIVRALRNPRMAAVSHARDRARLLHAYAVLARHRDVAAFTPLAARLRAQLGQRSRRASGNESPAQPPASSLDRLQNIVAVARTCADGDLGCYRRYLDQNDADIAGKAALLAAWTAPPAPRQTEVRDTLLARLERADASLRPALFAALESVAAVDGCECSARLETMAEAAASSAPPAPWQLDALFLAPRLRGHPAPASPRQQPVIPTP